MILMAVFISRLFLKQFHANAIRVVRHGRTTSYRIVLILTTNYRNKSMFLKWTYYDRFSSFDILRFPGPLERRELWRLAEHKREKSFYKAENLTMVTTSKLGAFSFIKADLFK